MGSKKQIVIATVPLNGARDAEDPSIVDNTPREVVLDEPSGSIQIIGLSGPEFKLIGAASSSIQEIGFNTINQLPLAQEAQIICSEAFPAGAIPGTLLLQIEEAFEYPAPNLGFRISVEIVNIITGNIGLVHTVGWELISNVPDNTILAVKFDLEGTVYTVSPDDLNVIVTISYLDPLTGNGIDNPKTLIAGKVKLHTQHNNATF